jgi:hypothetical protein
VARNTLFLVGASLERAYKLSKLYGPYVVQIKEVQNPVIGTLTVITAHPQHRQFFTIVTNLYSSLIEEYGFTITQNPEKVFFLRFLNDRQSI